MTTKKKVLIVLISDFIIYSSLGSFYIPCFVMIFLYGRIFKVTQTKACSKLESLPPASHFQSSLLYARRQGAYPHCNLIFSCRPLLYPSLFDCAMTLNITISSITTFSITTLSIMPFSIIIKTQHSG
jgi:hypothetical protein